MSEQQRTLFVDSSAVIAAFRNIPEVVQRLSQVRTVISPIVLAELYQGAYKAVATTKEFNKIAVLMQTCVIVNCDQTTARIFAEIRRNLEKEGKSIPLHDIWIAASAIQYDLPLATKDEHFSRIPELRIEWW